MENMVESSPPGTKTTFVATLSSDEMERLKVQMNEVGFDFGQAPYARFTAYKSGIHCTAYTSGKFVAQGKALLEFIEFTFEPCLGRFSVAIPEVSTSPKISSEQAVYSKIAHIGQDEAGKGDLFGPLCVAAVFVEPKLFPKLETFGIRDTKLMRDGPLRDIAKKIREHCPNVVAAHVPDEYNRLYARFGNLNVLLAWAHADVCRQIVKKVDCRNVLIDQFAAPYVLTRAFKSAQLEQIHLQQHVRAESDLAVAAAAILARDAFLQWLDEHGKKLRFSIPKGGGAPAKQAARDLLAQKRNGDLKSAAKWHFKTIAEVLSEQAGDAANANDS